MKIFNRPEPSVKYKYAIVLLLAVFALGPWLINLIPVFYFYPDYEYVKAKIIDVSEGNIFADPVSGYDNFHPPFYHMILSPFYKIGIPLDYILWSVTIINILLMYIFVFKIIRRAFDDTTAVITVAMLPFINEFMGCGYILLPTSFYAGVSFYLVGLWFYLSPDRTNRQTIYFAALWGVAFLISPAFLFLIGFPMLHELVIVRNFRQFTYACITLLICLIPFFYQAYVIFSQGLFGTSAFAFWRGLPGIDSFSKLATYIVNPTTKDWSNPLIWAALPVTVIGIVAFIRQIKKRPLNATAWFVILAALAYLLTFYHFKPQYAIRVHFFVSIFLTAYAVRYFFQVIKFRSLVFAICAIFAIGGFVDHYMYYRFEYNKQNEFMPEFNKYRAGMATVFGQYVSPDDYIIAYHVTYRHYIMPFFSAHGLQAYRSGEYYQLTSTIATDMQQDYEILLSCLDVKCLDRIADKYNIKIAIANQADFGLSLIKLIDQHWRRVYEDPYFRIYQRP